MKRLLLPLLLAGACADGDDLVPVAPDLSLIPPPPPLTIYTGPPGSWTEKVPSAGYESLNYDWAAGVGFPEYADADLPDAAADASGVWMAWKEDYLWRLDPTNEAPASPTDHESIFVRRWQNGGWAMVGDDLNDSFWSNVHHPSLALSSGVPYVAFIANDAMPGAPTDHHLYVKRWNDATDFWDTLGNAPVPVTAGRVTPNVLALFANSRLSGKGKLYDLTVESGTPWLAYIEDQPSCCGHSYYLVVRYFDGTTWQQVGGAANEDTTVVPQDPKLVFIGTGTARAPYLAWREAGHLYVKHLVRPVVIQTFPPQLPRLPYWTSLGPAGDLRLTTGGQVGALSLAGGASPIVAWSEQHAATQVVNGRTLQCTDVYVKAYDGTSNTWHVVSGLLLNGAAPTLDRVCGQSFSPFSDVVAAVPPNGQPYVAVASTDYTNGDVVATSAQVTMHAWVSTYSYWKQVASTVDNTQAHPFNPETRFFRVAMALTGATPWVGYVRQHPLPYTQDPYNVVRPAYQLYVKDLE